MRENRKEICDEFCKVLQLTNNANAENRLVELRFVATDFGEIVRPVFADGTGLDGRYDVDVTGCNGTKIIMNVTEQFVSRLWALGI